MCVQSKLLIFQFLTTILLAYLQPLWKWFINFSVHPTKPACYCQKYLPKIILGSHFLLKNSSGFSILSGKKVQTLGLQGPSSVLTSCSIFYDSVLTSFCDLIFLFLNSSSCLVFTSQIAHLTYYLVLNLFVYIISHDQHEKHQDRIFDYSASTLSKKTLCNDVKVLYPCYVIQ